MDLVLTWDGELHRVELADGEHVVGRGPDSNLQIPVATVSKRHAQLRVDGDRLFVRELGSTNGTDIDGRALKPSDGEVELPAQASVRFAGVPAWRGADMDADADTSPPQFSEEGGLLTQVSYRAEEEGYSDTARTRIVEMLSSLFELVASDAGAKDLGKAACEFVSRWVDADRVVLLEDSGEGTLPSPLCQWKRATGGKKERIRLSTTLVNQVIQERESVLVADVDSDPLTTGRESVMALQLRSAMAAPLFDNERVRGILYVDSARAGVRYGADDLQVLSATSSAVAIKLRNLSLEKELNSAARIQQAMLPEEPPAIEGYQFLAHQVMCRQVGGDLWDVLPRDDGTIMLALGDVAGKGTPAALAMAASVVLLRVMSEIGDTPQEMVEIIHRHLWRSLAAEQFITLFVGLLHPESGHIVYVNAGHEPPLVIHPDGSMDSLPSGGMPVAFFDPYTVKQAEITLGDGDLLAVFSDGIPEATRDAENLMGLDKVTAILREQSHRSLEELCSAITGEVDRFLGGSHASDDVTLMLLRKDM